MNRDEGSELGVGSCTLCGKGGNSLTYTGSKTLKHGGSVLGRRFGVEGSAEGSAEGSGCGTNQPYVGV